MDEVEDDHVSEELIELVPGLIWAVVETGQGEAGLSSSSENLVMAPSPEQPSPSFLETMFHVSTRMPSTSEESMLQKTRHLGKFVDMSCLKNDIKMITVKRSKYLRQQNRHNRNI